MPSIPHSPAPRVPRAPGWALAACVASALLLACAGKIQGTSPGSGGGTGPTGPTGPASGKPVVTSFSATPASLPTAGGTVTLSWQVSQAESVSVDHGVGTVAGQSVEVPVGATTVFTLTATNASGASTSSTAVVVGSNASSAAGRYVAMVAPVAGETFTAPASLRLVAAAHDPNVFNNSPSEGLGGNASSVEFFVDDTQVLQVDGSQAEYWIFKGFTSNVAAGVHRVWARAIYTNPSLVLDSVPVVVTVAAPAYASTVSLTSDLVVSGAYSLVGTPTGRIQVLGNGHSIVSGSDTGGAITFRYVDFVDVGDRSTTSNPGINLTSSGGLDVENCNFDYSNTTQFAVTGSAPATFAGNTWRSNMRQPLGQGPSASPVGNGSGSFPASVFTGMSTGAKVFQGNNGGAGWMLFSGTQGWTIGGDTDAQSNVLIGPRVGIYATQSQNLQIRHNYTHHIYYGGWSQGSNYELGGIATVLAEHNVVAGSSWPVRGVAGEFRYNLVLDAGHEWLWADNSGAYVHHNLFVGGDLDVGGIYILYGSQNVRIENNTIDGQSGSLESAGVLLQDGVVSLSSNLFLNLLKAPVSLTGGTLTADYNLFWNSSSPDYSDGRQPAHDVAADPKLGGPPTALYDFDETGVWTRALTVHGILQQYRAMYAPATGSPSLGAGDPAGGAGNFIGAIGGGSPADLFGQ